MLQSWEVLVAQTESLSQLMKRRSEDLQEGPINKLTLLIRDKQQLRKNYSEQWSAQRQELIRVTQTALETLKNSYRQAVRNAAQAKRKYQEVIKEREQEKAKERYVKASVKLYDLHNEYVLSVRAAQVYHQQHHRHIQPALLQALQSLQQEMLLILKEILQEYFDISTLLHHEVVHVHREMSTALTAIDPHCEYDSFIQQNRSVGEDPACVDFDLSILDENGRLFTAEIDLNDLTLENIQHKLTALEEELMDLARTLGSKQSTVEQLEQELCSEREGVTKGQRVYQFSKSQALEQSRQQVVLSQGLRAKLEVQRLLLKEKLEQLGSEDPPPALELSSSSTSNDKNQSAFKVDGFISNLSGLFKTKSETPVGQTSQLVEECDHGASAASANAAEANAATCVRMRGGGGVLDQLEVSEESA
uniref:F-BAR domain-containing protein n=1 Tax=Knipowitschia caucasica TaxID=637954 RepID=A0AAV2J5R7_KNICA